VIGRADAAAPCIDHALVPAHRAFTMHRPPRLLAALLLLAPGSVLALAVTAVSPARHANTAPRDTAIAIDFDRAVDPATVTAQSFWVWGRSGGRMPGSVAFANGGTQLVFTPQRAFFPGETITVQLARGIAGGDGSLLPAGGHAFQFTTRAGVAPMRFTRVQSRSVRTTTAGTVLYGGAFPDLNGDGWIDYVGVNEASADLRSMLNTADGSGRLGPVLLPPRAVGAIASPSEAVDFDRDGRIDMTTGNRGAGTVSVVLGNGDGTFRPQQALAVGNTPNGVAALDIDGDADLDIATAVNGSNHLRLLVNDGNGGFTVGATIEAGASGEWSLAAGDMDRDGRMDLVVGAQNDQRILVLLGDGAGGYARPAGAPANGWAAGGTTWMVALGDLDADGDLDVTSVNGGSNNGAILRNNGDGTLAAATVVPLGGLGIATDLGDLDGDGDLDWVTSTTFGAPRWSIFANDGNGGFTLSGTIAATQVASCASLYDIDNDGDLDLALADEFEDEVLVYRNGGNLDVLFGDGFE
jgi:hypothetical protein